MNKRVTLALMVRALWDYRLWVTPRHGYLDTWHFAYAMLFFILVTYFIAAVMAAMEAL
jgi:hypothetical protein